MNIQSSIEHSFYGNVWLYTSAQQEA